MRCGLLLLSCSIHVARGAATCEGSACSAPPEDGSLMQLDRLGMQAGLPSGGADSFVLSSKPYFQEGLGWGQGGLVINEDGALNTYYLPGALIRDGGKTVKYIPPYRYYLMKSPTTDYSNKDNFYMPSLLGKTLSVDVDLKRHGPSCGCYLTFYLVGMPAAQPGHFKDYYCDAQCYKGMGCCAELMLNEGNMNVQQTANHACTADYAEHPGWQCGKTGDPQRRTTSVEFGHGVDHSIDSGEPFHYAQSFEVQGDDLKITTVITQGRSKVEFSMGPGSSQLNAMLPELTKGMALVTGYWYQRDMEGLDSEACGDKPQDCNMRPAYISNWTITTNGGTPAPQPSPTTTPVSTTLAPTTTPVPTTLAPTPTPPPAHRRRRGHCCWGHDCTSCTEHDAVAWTETQGFCRGGDAKWAETGQWWDCHKALTHQACRSACASNPNCMAYDRPDNGGQPTECCSFKGGFTGDSRNGRHCFVRAQLPSTHPTSCSESSENCWQCSGAWCDNETLSSQR